MHILDIEDIEWKENGKGNFVGLSAGLLYATVFSNVDGQWQIVINDSPIAHLVKNERFEEPEEAISRAEAILQGSPYKSMLMIPREE